MSFSFDDADQKNYVKMLSQCVKESILPNYFSRYALIKDIKDPFSLPRDDITNDDNNIKDAISKLTGFWNKNKNNPKYTTILQQLLDESTKAKSVLLDEQARKSHKELAADEHFKRLKEKYELLDEILEQSAIEACITTDHLNHIHKKFSMIFSEEEIDGHIQGKNIRVIELPPPKPLPPMLEPTIMQNIRKQLNVFNVNTLYDFLGLSQNDSIEQIKQKYSNLQNDWNKKPVNVEKIAAQGILGYVKIYLIEGDTQKYINGLLFEAMGKLDIYIDTAFLDGVLEDNEIANLISKAKAEGIKEDFAQAYILDKASKSTVTPMIISERKKRIIEKIREEAKAIYRKTKGTPLEDLGKEVNLQGQNLLQIRDSIGLKKSINHLQIALFAICAKMPKGEKRDACELLEIAKKESFIEDKIDLINMILSKIPPQMGKMKDMGKIEIEGRGAIVVRDGNVPKEDLSANSQKELNKKLENRKKYVKDENTENNIAPYLSKLGAEIYDLFKSVYQKERKKGVSEVNSKTLEFLKYKLLDLNASGREINWLDVGCGDGRCLEILDAIQNREKLRYYGIDSSYKYLDDAERRALGYNLDARFDKRDAATMRFDSEYDVVSAVLVLHEVDPLCLPYVLRNMLRALKDDGTLVISDFQGPYEQEEGVVAWSAEDIIHLLENIGGAKISIEFKESEKYPKELGFYRCYVKKPQFNQDKFNKYMQQYGDFLDAIKEESKHKRKELRSHIEKQVRELLNRSNIDTKNISQDEMRQVLAEIGDEYGIKAHKIRLLTSQIEFLDDKIKEFNNGTRCTGVEK